MQLYRYSLRFHLMSQSEVVFFHLDCCRLTQTIGVSPDTKKGAERDTGTVRQQDDRDRLRELASQKEGLRRVATLVARGGSQSDVFSAVAEEMAPSVIGRDSRKIGPP